MYNECPGAMRRAMKYVNFANYHCNWVKYEGGFKNGLQHGKGYFILSNSEKFEGNWENGKVHGDGEIFKTNGEIIKARWINNKRIEEIKIKTCKV